jgi:hypothetical protein
METNNELQNKKSALFLAARTNKKSNEICPQYPQREKHSLAGIPGI